MLKTILCSQLRQNSLHSIGWTSGPDARLWGGLSKDSGLCSHSFLHRHSDKATRGRGPILVQANALIFPWVVMSYSE